MAGQPQPPSNNTLTSWKEIAQYFGREVRTVQRWEKEEGLPVRRHMHQRQGRVYAHVEELDAWWRERGSKIVEPEAPPRRALPMWMSWVGAGVAFALFAYTLWVLRAPAEPGLVTPAFRAVAFEGTRPGGEIAEVVLGDVNGDSRDDLVLSAHVAREIYIVFGGQLPASSAELPAAASVVLSAEGNFLLYARQISDLNGDGIADLVIGQTLGEPDSHHHNGETYLVWGQRQWPRRIVLPEAADVVLQFHLPVDVRPSPCLANAHGADLNADGIPDLLLGAYEYPAEGVSTSGGLFVFYGRRAWPKKLDVPATADITLTGTLQGEGFGGICALGDFDGDSRTDLAVIADEGPLWLLRGGRGRVYIFRNPGVWPRRLRSEPAALFRVDRTRPATYAPQIALADVNGDGRDDLIMSSAHSIADPRFPGEVSVWLGGPERRGVHSPDSADVIIQGPVPNARFGTALVATDLDGDSIQDILLSQFETGEIFALLGRRDWPRRGRVEVFQPIRLFQGTRSAGAYQISRGDSDSNGLLEIAFAAPEAVVGPHARAGRAWLVEPFLPVRVDLRPDVEPNVIVLPKGSCAVRVYGFSRREGEQLEPDSFRMAGAAPMNFRIEDYNRDGFPDVQLYFENDKLKLDSHATRILVRGRTRDGVPVAGSDTFVISKP